MKPSSKVAWIAILFWPVEAFVFWLIWNGVVVRVFGLPHLVYWEVLLLLLLVGCLFPNSYALLLGKIADLMGSVEE